MRRVFCMLLCLLAAPVFAALDLNSASEAELDALPGVGPSRAQAIIEHRTKNGPFTSVDELRNVKGIGDKTFAELKPLLVVGAGTPAPVAPRADVPAAPQAAPAPSGGFPWWIVAVIAVGAAIAFVLMRRRGAPQAPAQAPVSVPEAPVPPARPAAASAPKPAASSPPPRPAGGAAHSTSGAASAPPARPAGAPPRPAGSSAPAQSSATPADAPSSAPPKPAGAPPKPAGSR
ncbi:ComEA family DNA-binding protein [Methyloversatilis discipulorum]|uniref:ComEA family DNA-binding protein n=1 Tax=Methyloversatilis discipulorum TaxID=1119528 RepID=UPI001A43A280|nr:helix-hairpin-helix domain-containing protein [Methyloversatilis discipulorum]MBL8469850.1 helix-hairpin-helix domain-containing protein [Methyloversatilis discipulorum]